MNTVNPFSSKSSIDDSHLAQPYGQDSDINERVSEVSLQVLEGELKLLASDSSVDRIVIEEKQSQLEFLRSEIQALQDIMQECSYLVVQQGEDLDQVEEHVEVAKEEVIEADEHLDVAKKEVKKGRRAGVGAVVGGSAGGVIGLVGFAVNPAVGVLMLLGGAALGGGVGGLVGMNTK